MSDFTSSLYLGMKHSSTELAGWDQITTGVPAAVYESAQSKLVSNKIACMQGLEKGISAPSTLHLYWDLFGFLAKQQIAVFIDEKIYQVSKYGIERLIVKHIPIYSFRHLDANHLYELVEKKLHKFTKPVVFTDGWCPQCGKPAPIKDYSEIVKPYTGNIIIDDTQAFGILGKKEDDFRYGYGGGGILKWLNVRDAHIITITSLAKAFAVPVAVICGNESFISAFEENSETRITSSPVSIVNANAALNALTINDNNGDLLRKKMLKNILLLKQGLNQDSIQTDGGYLPVQTISSFSPAETRHLFNKLKAINIATVLTEAHWSRKPCITVIIRSDHSADEIFTLQHNIKNIPKIFSLL